MLVLNGPIFKGSKLSYKIQFWIIFIYVYTVFFLNCTRNTPTPTPKILSTPVLNINTSRYSFDTI